MENVSLAFFFKFRQFVVAFRFSFVDFCSSINNVRDGREKLIQNHEVSVVAYGEVT